MCLTFLFMGIALQGMGAFMAMILMDLGQLSPEGANLINSFISIGVVLCTIIGGAIYTVVTRKAKSKRGLLLFILVIVGATSVYCILTCVNNTATCWIFSMFFALCSTMYLPGMYILSAEHAGTPALASMGLTIFVSDNINYVILRHPIRRGRYPNLAREQQEEVHGVLT